MLTWIYVTNLNLSITKDSSKNNKYLFIISCKFMKFIYYKHNQLVSRKFGFGIWYRGRSHCRKCKDTQMNNSIDQNLNLYIILACIRQFKWYNTEQMSNY